MATVELAQLLFVVDRKLNAGEIQLIRRVLQKRCDRLDAELALARESIGAATARLGRAGK
ncbi:MAG: hypothetical protein HYS13_00520 [Planctomycetia bacterium]|nr:hypothetical protein [Planctomycetia bacterium]